LSPWTSTSMREKYAIHEPSTNASSIPLISHSTSLWFLFSGFLKYSEQVEKIGLVVYSEEHGSWPVEFSNR
jgi:hypothetical protein